MSQKEHTPEQVINKLQEAQVLVEEYVYVSANYPIGPSAVGHANRVHNTAYGPLALCGHYQEALIGGRNR